MRRTHTGSLRPEQPAADGRLSAPSAERNLAPILEVLRDHMPASGSAVELASGTGQQIVAFAEAYPDIVWTPTDVEDGRLASIEAWRASASAANVNAAIRLNVEQAVWPFAPNSIDVVATSNLLHLISEGAVQSLFDGVGRILRPGGKCFVYGPFMRDGALVSEGDRQFHAALVAEDPAIGYKDRDAVAHMAEKAGLRLVEWRAMPANNLMMVAAA